MRVAVALVQKFLPVPRNDQRDQIGLQVQRARSTEALAAHLSRTEAGTVPNDLQRLLAVPGIGAYGARAVLSFAHGRPYAIVDSNVRRVLSRVFEGTLPDRPSDTVIQQVADTLLPREGHALHNFALLDLSAAICRYQRPRCSVCPLSRSCDAKTRFIAAYREA